MVNVQIDWTILGNEIKASCILRRVCMLFSKTFLSKVGLILKITYATLYHSCHFYPLAHELHMCSVLYLEQ